MDREHRRLNQQMESLTLLFAQLESTPTVRAELLTKLQQFAQEIATHFTEEEEGGCVEEAVCRCPSLSHEASVIERQHRELRAQLATIQQAVDTAPSQAKTLFADFCGLIEEHEALETRVLQRGFNTADEV
jgi:hypothetical protein